MEYSLTDRDVEAEEYSTSVLILILMEYSLTVSGNIKDGKIPVLILILMEYSLTTDWGSPIGGEPVS